MKFKRDSVIAFYLAGKPQVVLVRVLRHLNVNKTFASRKKKKTVTTPEMIRKKTRFDRNPRRSGRKTVREENISRERMQHILKKELVLKPFKFQKV